MQCGKPIHKKTIKKKKYLIKQECTDNIMEAKSQEKRILDYLQNGGKITPLEALDKFGCLRLSGRIYDLKRKGYNIKSNRITVNKKQVAQYSL